MQDSILVPVLSQHKLGGLCQDGNLAYKWWGWQRWGHQLVGMRWQSIWIVGASACVIFILHQKIQKMANKDTTFECHPVGTSICLHKQEVGKPRWNAAQPCARVMLMMT